MKRALLLTILIIAGVAVAECPSKKFAVLIQGVDNDQFLRTQNDLLRTILMNNYDTKNILVLNNNKLSLKKEVLQPTKENFESTITLITEKTTCADEVLINIASDAVLRWQATIEKWDGIDRRQEIFAGKPYASVQQKDYSLCYSNGKIKHIKECSDLVNHHRDVPDGYRVVGEPVMTDWCFMLGNECMNSGELNRLLKKLPACSKRVIAAASYSGILADLINAEVYTAARTEPASYAFHNAFVQALFRTKMNLPDSFAQAKAFTIGTTGTAPQAAFQTEKCKCDCPAEAPTILVQPKAEEPEQSPAPQPPAQPTPAVVKPSEKKVSILVKPKSEPAIMKRLPETDCLAQCAKIAVPAPRGAVAFSTELIDAKTPKECRQKAGFATFLQREQCMNYFVTIREISRRVGSGTEFACCCRRIAKETIRECTPERFAGWTEEGMGLVG